MKKKITCIFLLMFILIANVTVYAAVDISNVINHGGQNTAINSEVLKIRNEAIAIMQVVGVAFATIMLLVVGIYYIMAAPNDKAEVKKYLIPFVIGAIFIFGASAIVGVLKGFSESTIRVQGTSTTPVVEETEGGQS